MKQENWRDNFKTQSLRVGFKLGLTRNMCEYLSAVADGVQWNKSFLGNASPDPDNFIATSRSLVLRGLIEQKPRPQVHSQQDRAFLKNQHWNWNNYQLTPAGVHVVELLKIADLFIEAEAVTYAKTSKAK